MWQSYAISSQPTAHSFSMFKKCWMVLKERFVWEINCISRPSKNMVLITWFQNEMIKCITSWQLTNKYVSGDWPLSILASPTSTCCAIFHERRISSVSVISLHLYGTINRTFNLKSSARDGRFAGRFWASGGAEFPKMGDSLPQTPVNRPAKFDDASFILAGEICNHTNKQKTR